MNKLIAVEILLVVFFVGSCAGAAIEKDNNSLAGLLIACAFWCGTIVGVVIGVTYWISL